MDEEEKEEVKEELTMWGGWSAWGCSIFIVLSLISIIISFISK